MIHHKFTATVGVNKTEFCQRFKIVSQFYPDNIHSSMSLAKIMMPPNQKMGDISGNT